MNDEPRWQLRLILAQHGPRICDDPHKVEALLRDLCGAYKRENYVLVAALRAGVPGELAARGSVRHDSSIVVRLSERLHDELGLVEELAYWAVESWALALSVLSGSRSARRDEMPTPANPDALRDLWVSIVGVMIGLSHTETGLWLHRLGAKVQDSVTRTTDILIVGERPGQTKLNAAKKYKVARISASALNAIIEAFMRRELGENITLPRPANEITRWASEQVKIRRAKQEAGELCRRCGMSAPQPGMNGLCASCARMEEWEEKYARRILER